MLLASCRRKLLYSSFGDARRIEIFSCQVATNYFFRHERASSAPTKHNTVVTVLQNYRLFLDLFGKGSYVNFVANERVVQS
jgi:hypothetical protein